jgi:hypothetical protein
MNILSQIHTRLNCHQIKPKDTVPWKTLNCLFNKDLSKKEGEKHKTELQIMNFYGE